MFDRLDVGFVAIQLYHFLGRRLSISVVKFAVILQHFLYILIYGMCLEMTEFKQ